MRAVACVVAAIALGGCFDSLVGGECQPGWVAENGACRPVIDDGGGDDGDAGAGVCGDLQSDPDNCGACGHTCSTGICVAGGCVGDMPGHVVLIGHDYRVHHAAAARLLGNAAALSGNTTVRVAISADTSAPDVVAAVRRALTAGLAAGAHSWTQIDVGAVPPSDRTSVDVFLIMPRSASLDTSFALGESWAPALTDFVMAGGTVIGLDGPGGSTADLLRGTGITDVSIAATSTGGHVAIVAPGDALAVGVPSPYLAERGSTTFKTTGTGTIVATSGGAAIAIHVTAP